MSDRYTVLQAPKNAPHVITTMEGTLGLESATDGAKALNELWPNIHHWVVKVDTTNRVKPGDRVKIVATVESLPKRQQMLSGQVGTVVEVEGLVNVEFEAVPGNFPFHDNEIELVN